MDKRSKTVAEFFAGIGLMRMGLEQAGWKTVFANDIDPNKEEMYRANFGVDAHFHSGDVYDLIPSEIPEITLATASFPCNDLSLAGARAGLDGKSSSAFWGFVRILDCMGLRRPDLVLIENVPGFLTSHQGRDFEDSMLALNDLGYAVDPFIVDAAWFVPQSRQRLFVVASRVKAPIPQPVDQLFDGNPLRPCALTQFILCHPDINWRIRQLTVPKKLRERIADILEALPETSDLWWSGERATYLLHQMSPRHRAIADKMIKSSKVSYGTVFRRVRSGRSMAELRTDGLAGCLRTPRGGSGRQILFKAGRGKYKVRLLTPRECARLMGADDYRISVPLNQALFGFGDAVCVPVIRWIADNYLNPMWKEEYASKAQSIAKGEILSYRRVARA